MRRSVTILSGLLLAFTVAPPAAQSATQVEVRGTVIDATTGKPVAGARVAGPDISSASPTDSQGRFTILAKPGTHTIYANFDRTEVSDTEATGRYVNTPNLAPVKKRVTVTSSGQPDIELTMDQGGTVQGSLKTPAGVPFSTRLTLGFEPTSGDGVGGLAAQRANGSYVIPGLSDGTYSLRSAWCVENEASTSCLGRQLGSFTIAKGQVTTKNATFRLQYNYRGGKFRVKGTLKAGRTVKPRNNWVIAPDKRKYRWMRDGKPIGGATHPRYKIKRKDVGHRLSVRITGSGTFFETRVVTSPKSSKVKKK